MPTQKENAVILRALVHYIEHCETLTFAADKSLEMKEKEFAELQESVDGSNSQIRSQATRILTLEAQLKAAGEKMTASLTRRDELARMVQRLMRASGRTKRSPIIKEAERLLSLK